MFRKIIEKLSDKKRRLLHANSSKIPKIIETLDLKIALIKEEDYFKMEINDYISIVDYVDRMKSIDKYGIEQMVSNAVLWNSKYQKVNQGIYYIIPFENKLYNILINADFVKIDERIHKNKIVEEKIFLFDIVDKDYSYTYHNHDEFGDTFLTRYFNKQGLSFGKLDLAAEEFIYDFKLLINNLKMLKHINKIIELETIEQFVHLDLEEKKKIKRLG